MNITVTRIATIVACALTIAGCMVGPDYVRPSAPVPPAYKELDGWKVAQPGDVGPASAWWQTFGDTELDTLEAEVTVSNQTIAAAAAAVRVAQAATDAARSALFPSLTGSAPATRSSRTSAFNNASIANNYDVALSASWEVDLWGRVRRNVEASIDSAQASAADLAAATLSVRALVAQDYMLLRVQDAQLKLLRDTVAGYERSLQLTRNQYKAGIAARGDVVQAEAQLKSTQAQVIDAQITRAQLEHAIAVLIGKPPAELSIAPRSMAPVFPTVPMVVPSELLERRPDIAAAERRVAAANAEIGVAQAAFYPSLSLSGAGGYQSSALGDLLLLPARYWALGAALAQPLFDAGLRSAQKAQAVAAYDQTVANYRATVLAAFQDVEDNLVALRRLEEESGVQSEAVRAAQEAATIANNQYRAGTTNYFTVVVLQAQELTAERTALAIVGRRLVATVGLIKAMGGGWTSAERIAIRGNPTGS